LKVFHCCPAFTDVSQKGIHDATQVSPAGAGNGQPADLRLFGQSNMVAA
jgi:hypothetical protein